jgi:hypothetical protein
MNGVHLPSVGVGMLAAAAAQLLVAFFAAGPINNQQVGGPIAVMGLVTGLLAGATFAVYHFAGDTPPSGTGKQN